MRPSGAGVFEARAGAGGYPPIGSLQPDKPAAEGDDAVSERAGEFLSVAHRTGFRVAYAAGRDKHVFRVQREIARLYGEAAAVKPGNRGYRTVGYHRERAVAQNVAESVDDGGRLAGSRKHPRVRHASQGESQRFEAGDYFARRTFAHGAFDESGGRMGIAGKFQIAEEIVGGDVFGEIASAVRGHQHFRAEPRLALDQDGADAALGGGDGGEHAGGSSADDRQFRHFRFIHHVCDYTIRCGDMVYFQTQWKIF